MKLESINYLIDLIDDNYDKKISLREFKTIFEKQKLFKTYEKIEK